MSIEYYNSPEHLAMLKREREYNLVRLQKVRDMLDAGEIKDKKEFWIKNDVWEQNTDGYCNGYVACIGVQCEHKTKSTKHECPLEPTKEGCWWIHARLWRLNNDKKKHKASIMRRYSDR